MTDFDPTSDWTEPTLDEIRAIRKHFDRGGDRADRRRPNPLFAGREVLIGEVERDLRWLRESNEPIANLTRVLYGAPGAGKSEVLVHLEAEFARRTEGGSPVLVVRARRAHLTDPVAFGEAVYSAAGLPRDQMTVELTKLEAGGSLGVIKGSAVIERRARRSATVLGRVADAINRDCHNPTILLLVDEAQKKLVDVGDLPLDLHEANADLKVLPVYGGLGDTLEKLGDAGVSRLEDERVHLLGRLRPGVVFDICKTGLSALAGCVNPALDRWSRHITKRTDAWPMHVSHCLRAVQKRQNTRMGRPLDDAGFDQAMRDADKKRARYYGQRLNRCKLLSRAQYVRWADMFERVKEVDGDDVAATLDLSKRDAQALVDQAVRAGLLEPTPEGGTYISPIPSLRDHIRDRGRPLAQPERSGAGAGDDRLRPNDPIAHRRGTGDDQRQ